MFPKKQSKSKMTHFSSEDSQNTDNSMDSSLEIEESNAQTSSANKFNQLRETMNQLFLANPELAEEIKFEQYFLDDDIEMDSPKSPNLPGSPSRKLTGSAADPQVPRAGAEDGAASMSSNKFWSVISKEMTKPQKNSKMPSLNQINHILNIFKTRFEKTEGNDHNMSPSKSSPEKKKDFRIQSAKLPGDKFAGKLRDAKGQPQSATTPQNATMSNPREEEDGVKYFSFRKKMHLKLKMKRMKRQQEELQRKREAEAERDKLAKEREQRLLMSTLAELDEELAKNKQQNTKTENHDEDASKNALKLKLKPSASRKNSLKPGGNIFDRLTKDLNLKGPAEEEDELNTKRVFISQFAETLYKDMKAFGDPEAFKKVAQTRIANYKKEFKEKIAKQKQLPVESLRFGKEKSRYLNMFVPDFEKANSVPNKDSIFIANEIQRDSEEWKENPEYEILAKFQKVRSGNILEFWQDTKDMNQ